MSDRYNLASLLTWGRSPRAPSLDTKNDTGLQRNRAVLTGAVMLVSGLFIFSGSSGVSPVITLAVWSTAASAVAGQLATWG